MSRREGEREGGRGKREGGREAKKYTLVPYILPLTVWKSTELLQEFNPRLSSIEEAYHLLQESLDPDYTPFHQCPSSSSSPPPT